MYELCLWGQCGVDWLSFVIHYLVNHHVTSRGSAVERSQSVSLFCPNFFTFHSLSLYLLTTQRIKEEYNTSTMSTQVTKKWKNQVKDSLESDGEDGAPSGKLRHFQKQLFDTLLLGKAEFDSFRKNTPAPMSFKALKAEVAIRKE